MKSSDKGKTKIKILLLLLVLLAVLGLGFALQSIDDADIVIQGNQKYSREEMIDFIFTSRWDKNPYILYFNVKRGKTKMIPFVDQYDVSITGFNKVSITVYEKKIIGFVSYMGTNMYFDKDGTVVESSSKQLEGVPPVTGLEFENIVLGEPLPVEDRQVFDLILDTTQALTKYSVNAEKLYVSKAGEAVLTIKNGEIEVLLGTLDDMDDKIRTVSDMMPNLEGLKGVLDLRVYRQDQTGYTFKKKE